MAKALDSVKQFAFIAFTLLGVLFGMVIMSFIFGIVGSENINIFTDDTVTITNQTGAFINSTGYTIGEASNVSFNGGFTVISAVNTSNGVVVDPVNYTVDSTAGTITNTSLEIWSFINLTYTYREKTDARLGTEDVQNNSLQAIVTYSDGASTQFNTISIAIILALLIAVFLIFWKIFVAKPKGKSGGSAGAFA